MTSANHTLTDEDNAKLCCFYSTVEYNMTSDGWIQYNESQYFINEDLLPMEEARAFCKRNHGDLVVITGQTERKFLWKQVYYRDSH